MSGIFTVGKPNIFERLLNTPQINDIADVLNKPGMSHKEIEKSGAEFMCKCYDEKSSTSLNNAD